MRYLHYFNLNFTKINLSDKTSQKILNIMIKVLSCFIYPLYDMCRLTPVNSFMGYSRHGFRFSFLPFTERMFCLYNDTINGTK